MIDFFDNSTTTLFLFLCATISITITIHNIIITIKQRRHDKRIKRLEICTGFNFDV